MMMTKPQGMASMRVTSGLWGYTYHAMATEH